MTPMQGDGGDLAQWWSCLRRWGRSEGTLMRFEEGDGSLSRIRATCRGGSCGLLLRRRLSRAVGPYGLLYSEQHTGVGVRGGRGEGGLGVG